MSEGPRKDARGHKRPPRAFVEALLENPSRQKIMELLEQRPGMNRHQLVQALGMHINAVDFHVQRLEEAGLIVTRPAPNRLETLCFTPENVNLWEDESTRALFGRGAAREVAVSLTKNPGASVKELADVLGMSPHTVRRHMRSLEEAGLVQRIRIDRQVMYHAEPELQDWAQLISGNGERKWRL